MNDLIESLEDFTWDNYKDISDALMNYNEYQIDNEMLRQASVYSYYHGLMCAAKNDMNNLNTELTQFMSKLRKICKEESSVKLTAKDLDDLVFGDPHYGKKQAAVHQASFKYELLKGLVRALEHKKDMIIQVAANKREETKLYK